MSDSSVPTTSKIEVTHTRLKGPSGVNKPSDSQGVVASGQVSVHMTVESISYDHWLEPKQHEDGGAGMSVSVPSDKDGKGINLCNTSIVGSGVFKNTVEIRTNSSLCDPADAIELNALKRELDFYKLHTQILLQTKILLEEKLANITNDFEDLKESLQTYSTDTPRVNASTSGSSRSGSRKNSAIIVESPDEELRFSLSPPGSTITSRKNSRRSLGGSGRNSFTAFHSAVENITFGVTEEFKNTTASPVFENSQPYAYDSQRTHSQRRSFESAPSPFSASLPRYQQRGSYILSRPTSHESFRSESTEMADTSPVSEELCRHFLKGRCRYKRLCKFSHEVATCPYCLIELPQAKIAASTHLSRCYKANGKPSANGSIDDDQDQDDE